MTPNTITGNRGAHPGAPSPFQQNRSSDMWVLVDTVNDQAFGPFPTREHAEHAARCGTEAVGGVPWGEYGWFVAALDAAEAYPAPGARSKASSVACETYSGGAFSMPHARQEEV